MKKQEKNRKLKTDANTTFKKNKIEISVRLLNHPNFESAAEERMQPPSLFSLKYSVLFPFNFVEYLFKKSAIQFKQNSKFFM